MNKKTGNLEILFNPESVAVVGASNNPSKLGYHVMKSLTEGGFSGNIVPVNPGSSNVLGMRSYPSLARFPGPIDLAVVVLPARRVPMLFEECAEKGIRGIVLITAGFKEIDDPEGTRLHREIFRIAEKAGIPVIGPNTFGMINLHASLNASFTPEFSLIRPGNVALVSQSGGMSHLMGFLAQRTGLGFSKIVGLGNRLNIDFPEILSYLMDDPLTRVIVLYMEGIDRGRDLLEAAGRNRGRKPVIVYKTGSARVGDAASSSHTGSMAGSRDVYKGVFRQGGILQVKDTEELLDGAKALSRCPIPVGPNVAVLSGQAGPGMAACDLCEARGLKVVSFTEETQEKINACLPPLAIRTNPVDMGPAWYDSEAIHRIVGAVLKDESVHGILFLMMFASANRDALKGISPLLKDWKQRKPVIGCIVAPPGIWDEEIRDLEDSGALVNFSTPERAAAAMGILWNCGAVKAGSAGTEYDRGGEGCDTGVGKEEKR
ncbi:MAG: CoA-binding protein [Deltaproteobacteria bacterium]|nr:CoA-binding protein [Deltaproteobacteria bacterium]